ncbi:MAG: DCC1-like thiol-disulfide oxidoreductase family protein [Desulforhopalus sp.]
MDNRHIIIFDGVCNFCNSGVLFIIKRDPQGVFAFTPMQSDTAKVLMAQYQIPAVELDTVLLIKDGSCYIRSDAVLEIVKDLTGFWYFFVIFKVLPTAVRDAFYRIFARNRYRLFGERESCMVPSAEIQSRFIE